MPSDLIRGSGNDRDRRLPEQTYPDLIRNRAMTVTLIFDTLWFVKGSSLYVEDREMRGNVHGDNGEHLAISQRQR